MIKAFKSAAQRARYPWRIALFGALAWSIAVGASTWLSLDWKLGYGSASQKPTIVLVYALGAFVAFPAALYVARFVSRQPGLWRTVAIASALGLATLGVTAAIIALEYRMYYAEWHAELFSVHWFWQQLFTTIGAVAQYAVIGTRFYLPFVPVLLMATALWANRLAH